MISILAEAEDVFITNDIISDPLQSFTKRDPETIIAVKLRRNRRKNLKDIARLK